MAAFNRARAPSRFRISEWAHATVLSVCWLADARRSSKPPATNSSHGLVNGLPRSALPAACDVEDVDALAGCNQLHERSRLNKPIEEAGATVGDGPAAR